eukprot:1184177-Prorocentrum_minimum.AAC.3
MIAQIRTPPPSLESLPSLPLPDQPYKFVLLHFGPIQVNPPPPMVPPSRNSSFRRRRKEPAPCEGRFDGFKARAANRPGNPSARVREP